MSNTIERKVKRPIVVHRPKKVINSKEKSLHRSVLSHSRIATGYKKKIAALLGNNRALAHALELAHIELTNRDKLIIELQRRVTLKSPKRFKAKLQKVCEHLHVIVALLQDVLDDCEDFAEPNTCSFNSQTSNCSRPDIINVGRENGSPLATEQYLTDDFANYSTEINTTPFPILQQPPPRLTTAAEMSAILEQSVLLADENLPPILFPEDESQVISNITTRPRSKSKSASSQSRSRGSKVHTESPQTRNSSNATNLDNANNPNNDDEVCAIESKLPSPPPTVSFKLGPSPKRHSPKKKLMHEESSPSPAISKSNCLDDSQNDFLSPEKTSSREKCVKRKSLSKRKSKKKILVVKLACTPKRLLARENMENTIPLKQHSDSFTSKNNRRKTFIVDKTTKANRTIVLSPEEAKKGKVNAASEVSNSELLKVCVHKVLPSPDQLFNGYDKNENNCRETGVTNFAEDRKGKSDSDNTAEAQRFNIEKRNDNSCTVTQDMDLCHSLIKNSLHETNAEETETGDLNSLLMNGIKPGSNSLRSSFMYGYDPLEGTSKNRKSSILLKKPKSTKSKSSSKIPQIKNKPTKKKPNNKPLINKTNTRICRSDAGISCISADSVVIKKESLNSPTKSHYSLPLKYNSQGENSQQKVIDPSDDCSHPVKSDRLEIKVNSNLSIPLPNRSPVNRRAKEKTAATWTESNRDQEVSSLDCAQPVVKLNDIFSSVKSPSLNNHCSNYVYISDLLGGVLKVNSTPERNTIQSESKSTMQNSNNEEETEETKFHLTTDASKIVETISEKLNNFSPQKMPNSEGMKKRRITSCVSYKEPSIRKKLRQGDPFTSDLQNVNNKTKKEKTRRTARSGIATKSYFEGGESDSEN